MKNKILNSLMFVIVLIISSCNADKQVLISVNNPLEVDRKDEIVVIPRQWVDNKMNTKNELPIVVKDENGILVPSQKVDTNGDMKWDELWVLVSIQSNQSLSLSLENGNLDEGISFPQRTNIRFATRPTPETYQEVTTSQRLTTSETAYSFPVLQFEGPGWENDKVGFRNYFDARNGIDIFGKTTSQMVLDSVGINEDYHLLQPWGMDILKVGNSLGAGAIAMQLDSVLYRVDRADSAWYALQNEGPIYSSFLIGFNGWNPGPLKGNINQFIGIAPGKHMYHSKVLTSGVPQNASIVTGIVTIDSDTLYIVGESEKYFIMATHDNQAYDGEKLGMAIICPREQVKEWGEAKGKEGITSTYYLAFKEGMEEVQYWFVAGWEKADPGFGDKEYFLDYTKKEAELIFNPLEVKLR
jgi:hypothetical protein